MGGPAIIGVYKEQYITQEYFDTLSDDEKAKVTLKDELASRLAAKKTCVVTINGQTFDLQDPDQQKTFGNYLSSKGLEFSEIFELLKNPSLDKLNKLQDRFNQYDEEHKYDNNRKDKVLLMDSDRYAQIRNFEKQEKLPDPIQDTFKEQFPKSDYPELYKKDGSLNERKLWNQLEDDAFFEQITGKSFSDRVAELVTQGKTEAEAKEAVFAQNKSFLKQEKTAQQAKLDNAEIGEEEQRFIDARENAHLLKKDVKHFSKNIREVTERINNAIDKMNEWDWNKDLNENQKDKIRAAVAKYNEAQVNNGGKAIEMFDENGNVPAEKKNVLYQFIMDQITGTDAQVNKSAKKGNFLQKIFTKRNKEFTEKAAARELGLNKKDIEKMGFEWENQISLGKTLLDGVAPALLGAAFGAAVSGSDHDTNSKSDTATATAKIDEQTITSSHSYKGSVDYLQNGELVMKIPYSGVIDCVQKVAGKVVSKSATATATATATASISAVLPAALIAGTTAMVNSAVNQGINGQEKDIFNENLYQILSTNEIKSSDAVARLSGLDPEKNKEEYQLAKDLASYYFDEQGEFHKTEFLTDWQYNGGYKSKYLNTQEAAMWLDKVKKRGPIKTSKPENTVSVKLNETPGERFNISAIMSTDVKGLQRPGATGTHDKNTTFDFVEGLHGDVVVSMNGDKEIDFTKPDKITGIDYSNQYKHVHKYDYRKLTADEVNMYISKGELPADIDRTKSYYILDSVIDQGSGQSIKANHLELYVLSSDHTQDEDGNKINSFKLEQPEGYAGSNQSAITSKGHVNETIDKYKR